MDVLTTCKKRGDIFFVSNREYLFVSSFLPVFAVISGGCVRLVSFVIVLCSRNAVQNCRHLLGMTCFSRLCCSQSKVFGGNSLSNSNQPRSMTEIYFRIWNDTYCREAVFVCLSVCLPASHRLKIQRFIVASGRN